MGVETASYISQLVSSNPVSTDPVGQGQNHLRLIKAVLQAQFPNFTAAALNSKNADIDTVVSALVSSGSLIPGQLVPTGTVLEYAGISAPSGYLMADGTSYATATYPALFSAIGYNFGGSGANFNVPDKRGRVGVGNDGVSHRLGNYSGTGLGGTVGEATHTLTATEMPVHNHSASDSGHTHSITDPEHRHGASSTSTDSGHTHGIGAGPSESAGGFSGEANGRGTTNSTDTGVANITTSTVIGLASTGITGTNTGIAVISVGNAGSGGAHNNVQPGLVMNYIIKT